MNEIGEQGRAIVTADKAWRTIPADIGSEAHAATLTGLVELFDQLGGHERARAIADHVEHVARTIANPQSQAQALAELAGAVGRAGQHDQASSLMAAALATGDWTDFPLDTNACFAQDALSTLCDVLLAAEAPAAQ